jgi:hypothetical protein
LVEPTEEIHLCSFFGAPGADDLFYTSAPPDGDDRMIQEAPVIEENGLFWRTTLDDLAQSFKFVVTLEMERRDGDPRRLRSAWQRTNDGKILSYGMGSVPLGKSGNDYAARDPVGYGLRKALRSIGQAIFDRAGMGKLHEIADDVPDGALDYVNAALDGVGGGHNIWVA